MIARAVTFVYGPLNKHTPSNEPIQVNTGNFNTDTITPTAALVAAVKAVHGIDVAETDFELVIAYDVVLGRNVNHDVVFVYQFIPEREQHERIGGIAAFARPFASSWYLRPKQ